jgi:penicillin-binding protein 1A
MAKSTRSTRRVEPHLGAEDGAGGGQFDVRLNEWDRSVPRDRGRKPAARGKSARSRRKRKGRGIGGAIRRVVRLSFAAGIVGIVGAGSVVAYYATKLPPMAEWTVPERPASVRILAADGALITNRGDATGQSLTLDEMPPYLPEAVLAIEDRRFWWHIGIDPIGLARAFAANITAGGVVQGGSTITQQLAKNLFLKPERTFERKVQEVILAGWLELSLSKKDILELYLNRVYLGAGAYGVDAAAHRYFGKSARMLTLAEAATIAGLLKAPGNYSPISNPAASEERAQLVIAAMREAGFIDDRQATLALATEVRTVRDVAGGSGRYVADWIMNLLPGYVGVLDQDIIVDTTIDLRMQAAAAHAIATTMDEEGEKFRVGQGALVAMDEFGGIKALVGGRDYSRSPFNRAVDGHRQPGSAFKPFVYLTALEFGMIPETVRIDQPVTIRGWSPENYSREYRGPVTLQTALALSLNTVAAQLAAEVGPDQVAATARRLGVTSPLMATPSIALGTSEVTPVELTAAFVPFSNGGRGVIPHVIDRIMTANGDLLYERSGGGPGQVVDPRYVAMMNAMLSETLIRGTGQRAQIANWQAAGKTGTSQEFRDAWFIGYTRVLTAGVWFGNDDNKPTKKASGSNMPATAWARFMTAALDGVPPAELPGGYRFRDPNTFDMVGAPLPVPGAAGFGEDGQRLERHSEDAMSEFMAGLDGSAPDGWIPPPPQERPRNLLQRLFGG